MCKTNVDDNPTIVRIKWALCFWDAIRGFYMQWSSSMTVPKQWTNQKYSEAGQVLWAPVYVASRCRWLFFFFFFECHHGGKAFPSNVSCAFRHKDVFCVNGPLHYSFPSPFPRQTVIPDCLILSRTSGCCHWNFIASSLSVSFTSIYF